MTSIPSARGKFAKKGDMAKAREGFTGSARDIELHGLTGCQLYAAMQQEAATKVWERAERRSVLPETMPRGDACRPPKVAERPGPITKGVAPLEQQSRK